MRRVTQWKLGVLFLAVTAISAVVWPQIHNAPMVVEVPPAPAQEQVQAAPTVTELPVQTMYISHEPFEIARAKFALKAATALAQNEEPKPQQAAALVPIVVQAKPQASGFAPPVTKKKKEWDEMSLAERESVSDSYAVRHCPGIKTPWFVTHGMILAYMASHTQIEVQAGIRSQCLDQKLAFR